LKSATVPFYTTEKKKNNQHFGLGLNICKILCQRHNGDISLKNCVNGGALVTTMFKME
jgi:K+-sensing histidine kinase KdpD